MTISSRDLILKNIFKNNKLEHFCLNKNWYLKNNKEEIYLLILKETSFLDKFSKITLRERIFYIENNLTETQICSFCGVNKLGFNKCKVKFNKSCGESSCLKKNKSEKTFKQHELMTNEVKKERVKKITIWQSRPIEEKYGKEVSENMKNIYRKRLLGKTYEELYGDEKSKEIKKEKSNLISGEKNPMKNIFFKKKQQEARRKTILSDKHVPFTKRCYSYNKIYIETNNERKFFRSSWEAAFWVLNQHVLYEKIRLPYLFEEKEYIYIVDFVDLENKVLYEVKPINELETARNLIKFSTARDWCKKNEYEFKIINENWLKENVKNIDFETYSNLKPFLKNYLKN